MRSSLVLFGLAALAVADLNQNANELRDVSDIEASKVEADIPSRIIGRAPTCCSPYAGYAGHCGCWSNQQCCVGHKPGQAA
ncbi:hypothetical protein E4U16_000810 [Claviceps sp. LM84 group G4]|nr:hypothetical protein E4U33_006410 [Claviceps sp. LM78 group G4]KAG6079792.1 hypothetical protein E4U16_000810 [Claviceps sp. LM84 group G4]